MARIVGARVHGDRLRRIAGPKTKAAVNAAVEAGIKLIQKYAVDSILANGISGSGHIVSNPGDPPNADTHELDQSIVTVMDADTSTGRVIATADYAADLERGNSRIEERPFMRPAGKKARPEIRKMVNRAKRSTL